MYISPYISSATFAWSSKLTVDIDSMGPGIQLIGRQFSNFLLGKVSLEFKLHGMSIFHDIQMATYFGTGWCIYCVCWYDLDPIQGQGRGAFELPTTSKAVHAGGDDRSPLAGLSGLWMVRLYPIFRQGHKHRHNKVSKCNLLKRTIITRNEISVISHEWLHTVTKFCVWGTHETPLFMT